LSSAGKKFFNYDETCDETEREKEQKEWEQKEGTERTIQLMVEARLHQNGNE